MNPTYSNGALKYTFNLGRSIGISFDKILTDICAVVSIDGKKILTMYPVDLSSEFDREGMTTNEELKKKRLMGVRK